MVDLSIAMLNYQRINCWERWDSYGIHMGKDLKKYGIHMLCWCIFFVGCWMLLTWHCLDKRRNLQNWLLVSIPSKKSGSQQDHPKTPWQIINPTSHHHFGLLWFFYKKKTMPIAHFLGFQKIGTTKLVLSAYPLGFTSHHDGGFFIPWCRWVPPMCVLPLAASCAPPAVAYIENLVTRWRRLVGMFFVAPGWDVRWDVDV